MKIVYLYVEYKSPIQNQPYDKTVAISREKHEFMGGLWIHYLKFIK